MSESDHSQYRWMTNHGAGGHRRLRRPSDRYPISVDCHQVRDRSWSNLRLEDPMRVPPYDWLCLTRRAEFSMNLSLFDDLRILGDAGGVLHVPPKLLQDGWVCPGAGAGAERRRIVEADKRSWRTPETLMPLRHEVTAINDRGDRYGLVGGSIGGCNWNGWPNIIWRQNLMRWTCNGALCWGESQEVQWHETVRLLSPSVGADIGWGAVNALQCGSSTPAMRVAIVGGGLTGLTAAWRLHCVGVTVKVFERSEAVGGRTRSVRQDGFIFDVGSTTRTW